MPENFSQPFRKFARETLTVSNTVKTLTSAVYNSAVHGGNQNGNFGLKATGAIITIDTAGGIRFTTDGTAPVAGTTGQLAANSGTITAPAGPNVITLESYQAIVAFKAIRDAAADIQIQVEYFA